jgi:hypothetical protein
MALLDKMINEFYYLHRRVFVRNITDAITYVLDAFKVPRNLRQYYADMIMYLAVCNQYGVQAEV